MTGTRIAVFILFLFLLWSCRNDVNQPLEKAALPEIKFPEFLKDVLAGKEREFSQLKDDTSRIQFLLRLGDEKPVYRTTLFKSVLNQTNDSARYSHHLFTIKKIVRAFAQTDIDSVDFYCKIGIQKTAGNPRYREEQAEFYRLLGVLNSNFSRNAEAIENFDKAIQVASKVTNKDKFFRYITEIGRVYLSMSEIDKARECYLKGKEYAEKNNEVPNLIFSLNSLGDVCRLQKKYSEAIRYHEAANEAQRINSGVEYEQWACVSLGKCYGQMGNFNKARRYFYIALKIASKANSREIEAQALLNISICDYEQGFISGSIENAKRAFKKSQEIPHLDIKKAAAKHLYLLYEKAGQFSRALEYHKMYAQLSDSMENKENIRKFAETEYRLKENKLLATLEQERQNLRFEQEKREQEARRHRIITGSVTLVLVLSVAFAFFIFRTLQQIRAKNRIIEEKQSEILKSIRYASRIQSSFLPSDKIMEKLLGRSNEKHD